MPSSYTCLYYHITVAFHFKRNSLRSSADTGSNTTNGISGRNHSPTRGGILSPRWGWKTDALCSGG